MAIANRNRALQFDWTLLTAHVRSQYLLAMSNQPEASLHLAPAWATALPVATAASSVSAYRAAAQ
jgi:hypothetical protein